MRRIKLLSVVMALILLMGCSHKTNLASEDLGEEQYVVGMWLSYAEVDNLLNSGLRDSYNEVLEDCRSLGVTDIFVHVRAFGDAVYPSELFPLRETANKDFDALAVMVELTHKADIRFHAWINPYRVRTQDEEVNALSEKSPARVWLQDENGENDINVCFSNGIYLNPASAQVRRLVIDGVREILRNYDVDGIHFDDYFYPTAEPAFDEASYNAYASNNGQPLSLADWRCANVNQLISGTYTAVKFFDKDLIFSVSPAASLQKNKENLFADVKAWISGGCVDWIIPQLYFGFEYPEKEYTFDRLLKEWSLLERAENVKLMVGLAAYKLDEADAIDAEEWQTNTELLARQTGLCRGSDEVSGHIYYSHTALFRNKDKNMQALESLLKGEKKYVEKD